MKKLRLILPQLMIIALIASPERSAASDIWPFNAKKRQQEAVEQVRQEASAREAQLLRQIDSLQIEIQKQADSIAAIEASVRGRGHTGAVSDDGYWSDHFDSMSLRERDSLLSNWYEKTSISSFENFFDEYINIDSAWTPNAENELPDSVYEQRLKSIFSPVHLPYNDIVKKYIVKYTSSPNGLISRMLGLSQYYFPMIEQELIKAGLPVELRILPIIESALQPTAKSRAAAVGLWQFVYPTGKAYGLEINTFVDERCDPLQSTRAACRMLKDLYKMFGDWSLAIAAYNCGPGNVNKAIARAGAKGTFWDIYNYLPRETRGYVPAFIAATYAFHYYNQHGINVTAPPMPVATDTIMVSNVMHLEQVASTIDIPIETLRQLNPQYRLDIIPAATKSYPLTLPIRDLSHYIASEADIKNKDSIYLKEYIDPRKVDSIRVAENTSKSISHTVRSGETLGGIARKYGVSTRQIMQWNNLKNANKLRIGQRLRIERRR